MSDDFERELKAGFLEEATQLLEEAERCFLDLEADPANKSTIEKIFRIAHNIKGSSKAVGFDGLGAFTHEFETFLLKCKNGEIAIVPNCVSLLLKCNDHLKAYIDALKADLDAKLDDSAVVQAIHGYSPSDAATPTQEEIAPKIEAPDANADFSELSHVTSQSLATSDVSLSAANSLAEEAIPQVPSADAFRDEEPAQTTPPTSAAPAFVQAVPAVTEAAVQATAPVTMAPASGAPSTAPKSGGAVQDESIRVSLSRLDKLLNFVGEMVILQTVVQQQAASTNSLLLRKTIHQMGKVTKEVQELSMSLRMVPLNQTFQKMQRIVRDTSALLGKKVNLELSGEETEVDKTVLEALSDPLVHLIRNAVDHGIEMPDARVASGKDESGTVILSAYQQSGKLIIEIKDNGGGIPADRLRQKALEKGILRPGQNISDKDAVNLIFHAGFSTKAQVTEVSGRGVGMDVVKTNIERMQGEIVVETQVGKGSTFKIVLPLTLAIIDGMVVRCAGERFIIPLSHVHESYQHKPSDLQKNANLGETLMLRGENLPVIRLAQALKRRLDKKDDSEQIAIIVRNERGSFATLVDDIIGQHQVVVKKLGNEVKSLPGYSGSAILGDGKPALILELSELSTQNKGAAA